MVKMVCRLDNLRRAPGPQGELKKIPRPGGFYIYMREDHGSYFPFPTSESLSSLRIRCYVVEKTDGFWGNCSYEGLV